MLFKDIKELKTGKRELRNFGLLVGGVFVVLGVLFLLRHKPHYGWFLVPGIGLMVMGVIIPAALKQVYIGWMSLAIVLGFIVSNVVLTLFFFLVITPIGLVARAVGKDFLRLKLDRKASTYWLPRERHLAKTQADYERQF
jgi:hypothetical protein